MFRDSKVHRLLVGPLDGFTALSRQMLWVQMTQSHAVATDVDVRNGLQAPDDLGMIWSRHTDISRMKSKGVGMVRGGAASWKLRVG